MNLIKKIIALFTLLSVTLTMPYIVAEEYESEDIPMYIGDCEETDEEKEYIVYFNDSVVSLYADEGKDYALMNEDELASCLEEDIVEFYEENVYVYLYGEESPYDPLHATYKWDFRLINADYALDKGYTGDGVKVAVIDSGCNATGDLGENILEGYNLVTNTKDVTDTVNHGTMVSAQIAAEMNYVGFRGVAPDAKIVPLKIFDDDSKKAKVSLVADAIKMAADDYDCDIINMSLGTGSDSETLKAAVQYAASKNVLMVAAMGNNGTDAYSYPAAYDGVIAVGAVDHNKAVCDYSQYNDAIDVCTPGGSDDAKIACLSPTANNKYFQSKGTSFSAPIVSGIAALFREADADFSHDDFMEIIVNASEDRGKAGYDVYYGYGMADVKDYFDYYLAPMGDNNADGKVTAEDALNIVNYITGMANGFAKEKAADVDKDGKITLKDAILVARFADGWDGYEMPDYD
ncbi:MAG: S8 family serine peptidase [Clostridia bacterium]|nr:S8 family serine peptidase [Clostridia bacterium]